MSTQHPNTQNPSDQSYGKHSTSSPNPKVHLNPLETKPAQEKKLFRVAVITVSDRAYQGIYKDESGPMVVAAFPTDLYEVVLTKIVPDDIYSISSEIVRSIDSDRVDVLVTTGGTGCSLRDVTPEATANVIQREVIGISEVIRLSNKDKNPNMILSRGISGIRNQTIVFNLPGSPENAKMALESVLPALPHCIKTMRQQRSVKRTAANPHTKKDETIPRTENKTRQSNQKPKP